MISKQALSRRDVLKGGAAACLAMTGVSVAGEDGSKNDGRSKYLVLDSRIIDRTENARLSVGQVAKHASNPLFVEDKPWEVRYDNLYANIHYDAKERLYKCWYNPFIVDKVTSNTPRDQRLVTRYRPAFREMGICYAQSKDGLAWEKPELGIIDFAGETANNLVCRGPHGSGLFFDARDPDPARRYKILAKADDDAKLLAVTFSPDGLHWSDLQPCPEAAAVADTHNNALWSPELQKYVGITRLWRQGQRVVGRTESDDFLNWTKTEEVLRGDRTNQTYAMPVFRYANLYLGLVMILSGEDDRVRCELAWSPDSVHWERIDRGTPLIPNSQQRGDYDWGCVYAARGPVVTPREIRLYYGGSNDTHGAWRDGCLALATLRPDGFAGYEPEKNNEPATLLTKPLIGSDGVLRLTADATGGEIRVTMLDEEGHPVATGKPVSGDVTDAAVTLEGDLSAWKKKPLRLRFEIERAKLFAFRV